MKMKDGLIAIVTTALTFLQVAGWALAQDSEKSEQGHVVDIVDSAGNPVDDVDLYWFGRGKGKRLTPANGTVEIPENEGLLVGRKHGFAHSGMLLKPGDEVSRFVLRRKDEAGRHYQTLPRPFDEPTRRRVLEEVLRDLWRSAAATGVDIRQLHIHLQLLARLDSERALEFCGERQLNPPLSTECQRIAALAILPTDPGRAIEMVDSMDDPMLRGGTLLSLLKNLPSDSPFRAVCENEMLVASQAIPRAELRLALWGLIGEYYEASGQTDKVQQIIAEHMEEAESLPTGGWSVFPRSLFAGLIVNEQPDRARELAAIEFLDHEQARASARLAFQCCRQHPDRAIGFLREIQRDESLVHSYGYETRVCQWMATAQPAAALQLAETIEAPLERAWTLGLIADRLAQTEPELAESALDQAIEILKGENAGEGQVLSAPSLVLGGLLPIAERVAPERIESMIWQAVWLALPRSRWKTGGVSSSSRIRWTAASIARFDRDIAAVLFETPPSDRIDNPTKEVAACSVADVKQVPELLGRTETEFPGRSAYEYPETLHLLLAGDGEPYWDAVSLPPMFDWTTDLFEDR